MDQDMRPPDPGDVLMNRKSPCANCQLMSHRLATCKGPLTREGTLRGCPLCNSKAHSWDKCPVRSREPLQDYVFEVEKRVGRAPLEMEEDWRDKHLVRFQMELEDGRSRWPWTKEVANFHRMSPHDYEENYKEEVYVLDETVMCSQAYQGSVYSVENPDEPHLPQFQKPPPPASYGTVVSRNSQVATFAPGSSAASRHSRNEMPQNHDSQTDTVLEIANKDLDVTIIDRLPTVSEDSEMTMAGVSREDTRNPRHRSSQRSMRSGQRGPMVVGRVIPSSEDDTAPEIDSRKESHRKKRSRLTRPPAWLSEPDDLPVDRKAMDAARAAGLTNHPPSHEKQSATTTFSVRPSGSGDLSATSVAQPKKRTRVSTSYDIGKNYNSATGDCHNAEQDDAMDLYDSATAKEDEYNAGQTGSDMGQGYGTSTEDGYTMGQGYGTAAEEGYTMGQGYGTSAKEDQPRRLRGYDTKGNLIGGPLDSRITRLDVVSPQPAQGCFNCGQDGHEAKACAQLCCRCGQSTHPANLCTDACKCATTPGHTMDDCQVLCTRALCDRDDEHFAKDCEWCCICGSKDHYAEECLHPSCICGEEDVHFGCDCCHNRACKRPGCKQPYICYMHCPTCGGTHGGTCKAIRIGNTGTFKCWRVHCKGTFKQYEDCTACSRRLHAFRIPLGRRHR